MLPGRPARRSVALPLALDGADVASYHSLLIAGLVPKAWVLCSAAVPCGDQTLEILNGVQIPWLSLAAFEAISILLIVYLRQNPMNSEKLAVPGLLTLVGAAFFFGMVRHPRTTQDLQRHNATQLSDRIDARRSPVLGS